MDLEWNRTTKLDFYLAQIAAEVCRGRFQKDPGLKVKDFILNFKHETPDVRPPEEVLKQRIAVSKMFWGALVKNPQDPPKTQKELDPREE